MTRVTPLTLLTFCVTDDIVFKDRAISVLSNSKMYLITPSVRMQGDSTTFLEESPLNF